MNCNIKILLSIFLLVSSSQVHAGKHFFKTAKEFEEVSRSLKPGDELILRNGSYKNLNLNFRGKGKKGKPIILRAETPGRVVLKASSSISISGNFLVVDGFSFKDGSLKRGAVIKFLKNRPAPATNCILRNTSILNYNPSNKQTRYDWVSVAGHQNIVEKCWFSGQSHLGVTLAIHLHGGKSGEHLIRNNYFGNRPRGTGNGFETLRIGYSQNRTHKARCVVSGNLFEKCDGEIEVISNKSSENVYSGNTFLGCNACLTLRVGDRCKVEENIFLKGDAAAIGGIRISGSGHTIHRNFFSGNGGMAGGAISMIAGIPKSIRTGYFHIKGCNITENVFKDNKGPLFCLDAGFGTKGRMLLPENVTISGNLLVASKNSKSMIVSSQKPTGIIWKNNVAVGGTVGKKIPKKGLVHKKRLPSGFKKRLSYKELKRIDVGPSWK